MTTYNNVCTGIIFMSQTKVESQKECEIQGERERENAIELSWFVIDCSETRSN